MELAPLGMTNKSLGGGDWRYDSDTGAGQKGISGAVGLNNIGLLVTTWGRVIDWGVPVFTVDDGSGVNLKCVLPPEMGFDPLWEYVRVTGISSCDLADGELHRVLLVRGPDDLRPL